MQIDWDAYRDWLGLNIRAERSRAALSQKRLAARMRDLGFAHWLHQTVGASERGERRVTAEEIQGLSIALRVSVPTLMGTPVGARSAARRVGLETAP
jgi:transcriptional regulator with XRE-family HTH domain